MRASPIPDFLYRYTSLSIMLQILEHSAIYLTDPARWHDKNDAKQLLHYRDSAGAAHIRAFCLTETCDSLTHWGQAQCYIQFKGQELVRTLEGAEGVVFKKVRYRKLIDLQRAKNPPAPSSLPFIKRYPYRVEKEWRVLWLGSLDRTRGGMKALSLDAKAVGSVTISQEIPDNEFTVWKERLLALGMKASRIHHSTLTENQRWLSALGIA